eukprot:CAMPEP_0182427554 /NCGR_PEP_ID=MMETSP1167-20130531/18361_1 /TAXON_ID=2988 /ORGANISM="Mallomonas Sp, Strain CCMP3275" /LENGTH=406 /DNA_ID=CAMNT_0024609867 /DNA_START=98 /DNA_END=1321 /DNA_ORIENTATION=+
MVPQGNKFQVTPDLQKGMITLTRTNDNLINFQWSDRSSNSVDAGLILFPEDVEFKKVSTGRAGDRVYMLKWRNGGKVLMFWMQDKSSSKDEENAKKVNDLINDPGAAVDSDNNSNASTSLAPDTATGMGPEAWMQLLGLGNPSSSSQRSDSNASPSVPRTALNPSSLSQSSVPLSSSSSSSSSAPLPSSSSSLPPSILGNLDLSSLLQSAAQSRAGTAAVTTGTGAQSSTTTTSSSNAALTSQQLQHAMASLTSSQSHPPAGTGSLHPSLLDILSPDDVIATDILSDSNVVQALIQALPEGQQSEAYLSRTLRSPQLRQALTALSESVNGENYGAILSNFRIDPTAGTERLMRGDAVGAFVSAVQATVDAQGLDGGSCPSVTETREGGQESKEEEKEGGSPMEEEK